MTYFYWAFGVSFAILFAVTVETLVSRHDD